MNDDEGEIQTECDGGDACWVIELKNASESLSGGAWPDPARLLTGRLRMELETVYAALGLSLTSSPHRVVKLAADLWDLLGKPEKASVLRSDAPTPLALFDLCRGVHRYSEGPHDPLWLIIAQNAQEGRRLAGTTTAAAKPWTSPHATVESVTEMIRRVANPEGPRVKVGIVDPWNMGGPQVIPVPPAYFDPNGPGGGPTITLAVGKSRFKSSAPASVPLEVADINRAEGEPQEPAADSADSADLLTRTLEHEAVVSGAAESEPVPVRTATEAMQRLGESVVSMGRGRALGFWYTNHRGMRAWRWVIPDRYWTGGISHYPDVFRGLFLDAFDLDRKANRSFLVDRMEGPFATAEPLDLPVGPTVDEQERLAELRAEGHTDHCASAQVAAGQECGCAPEAKLTPETPIEVGQVWIAKDPEAMGRRWERVVVKEGPNAGGLYGCAPQNEPDYLLSYVTAESLRSSMILSLNPSNPIIIPAPGEIIDTEAADLEFPPYGSMWRNARKGLTGQVHHSGKGWRLMYSRGGASEWSTEPISEDWERVDVEREPAKPADPPIFQQPDGGVSVTIDEAGNTTVTVDEVVPAGPYAEHLKLVSEERARNEAAGRAPDPLPTRLPDEDWRRPRDEWPPHGSRWQNQHLAATVEHGKDRLGQDGWRMNYSDGSASAWSDGHINPLWTRVADPPPTVPSGEVLSVEPAAVQATVPADGATRSATVIHTHDPEGKRDPRVNPWVGDRWAARVESTAFQIVSVYEHVSGFVFDAIWLDTNERMESVPVSNLDDRHYIGHFPPVSDVPPPTFRPAGLLPEGW